MYRLVTSLLRFTNVYNPHHALGARTAAPRIENCRTGATMHTSQPHRLSDHTSASHSGITVTAGNISNIMLLDLGCPLQTCFCKLKCLHCIYLCTVKRRLMRTGKELRCSSCKTPQQADHVVHVTEICQPTWLALQCVCSSAPGSGSFVVPIGAHHVLADTNLLQAWS